MNESLDVSEMEITAVVLLKLTPQDQVKLPRACRVCPDALWQVATNPKKEAQVRCFCPIMHVFTYGTKDDIPIQDCEHLYRTEEDEELQPLDDSDLPPHLRRQQLGEGSHSHHEPEVHGQDD